MKPLVEQGINRTYVYKIVLIGDGMVGKTSIRKQYMGQGFKSEYLNTVGADFAYFSEQVGDTLFKFAIWDLAGQPKFTNVRPMFYQGAFGALVVYDVTRPETFYDLDNWIDELIRNTRTEGVPMIIVANKMDLYEEGKSITREQALEYIEKLKERFKHKFDIGFIETSAKTGMNIKEAFNSLRNAIIKWQEGLTSL